MPTHSDGTDGRYIEASSTGLAGPCVARERDVRCTALVLALTAGLAGVASLVGSLIPTVGAPVIAILLGIAIAVVKRPSIRFRPGISFVSRYVLQGSIVVFGLGLSLDQVLRTGAASMPVLLGTLAAGFLMAGLAGRLLGLPTNLRTLIGVGTAICGASAIAAANSVIDAEEADVSYAITTIFTFNVVAVLLYPSIGHALGFSEHAFGLWAGTAINDLSSVVAASTIYGHTAASYGVVVKLTRSLAIVPVVLTLAVRKGGPRRSVARANSDARVDLRRIVPSFLVLFVVAVASNTAGVVPHAWHGALSDVAAWMITAALGAIGLSTDLGRIRHAGPRPLLLGAVLWLTVGIASIGLQAITGFH